MLVMELGGIYLPQATNTAGSDKIWRSSLLTGERSLTAGMRISSIASSNSVNGQLAEFIAVHCTAQCLQLLFLTYKAVTLSFNRLLHSIYHLLRNFFKMRRSRTTHSRRFTAETTPSGRHSPLAAAEPSVSAAPSEPQIKPWIEEAVSAAVSSALLTHLPVSSLAAPPPPETPAAATVSLTVAVPASSNPQPMISGVNPLGLSTLSQLPPLFLPVVPLRIQDRIVRGESVYLYDLLPERLMLEPDDCFELSMGAGACSVDPA